MILAITPSPRPDIAPAQHYHMDMIHWPQTMSDSMSVRRACTTPRFARCLYCLGIAATAAFAFAIPPDAPEGVAQIRADARNLREIVTAQIAKEFLDATTRLENIAPRKLYRDLEKRRYYSQRRYDTLAPTERAGLDPVAVDETYYYTTKYGAPLAYVRTLELYARHARGTLAGRRVLDFGYGTIGQLRLMALCGASAVGIEVDPMLRELYSEPTDQGPVDNHGAPKGSIKLIHGRFPNIAKAVGHGYDLVTAKNTLKNGFFNPERPVPKNRLMDLGVDRETFVRTIHTALKPGGLFIIYNICPAPSKPDEPYKHWADGRCPFPRSMLESAGFTVLDYNTNDNLQTRRLAKTLGWDQGEYAMDLENDLFGSCTVVRRKE